MLQSIRWRLIISYIFLALLVVGVVGSITYQLAQNFVENRELQSLRANAQSISLQAEPLMFSPFAHIQLQQLVDTSAFLGDMRVKILDTRQKLIADSGITEKTEQLMVLVPGMDDNLESGMMFYQLRPGMKLELPHLLTERLLPGTKITIIRSQDGPWGKQFHFDDMIFTEPENFDLDVSNTDDQNRSDASVVFPIGNPSEPVGFVELSEPLDFGTNLINQLKLALVIAGVGAVVLAVVFGLWNSYRLASPIKSLAKVSAAMGAGDLSVRARLNTGGEIGALGDQFNQMADNLQATIKQLEDERDSLRRFIADASHELRTPITALKNFNTLLQGPAASDPEAQKEFLFESQVQIDRLAWITANLLDLSRLDAGLLELELAEHDFGEIIESSVAPFETLAIEKGISLDIHLPENPVKITADRPRLEMAIGNLLDNAIKFSPVKGKIRVILEGDQERITVQVSDTGHGISADDLPHIFERFYRGRTHNMGGSGLGLSIVKSVLEAHGGIIDVESIPGEGTTFRLVWEYPNTTS
jgi:signal transduction histidine kinase